MQSMQPLPEKARLFVMPSNQEELHKANTPGPICHTASRTVLQPSTASGSRHAARSIPHAIKAVPVEGLATKQCSVAQYGATQARPQRTHAARNNAKRPSACSTAASACNARRSMQIRPESRCTSLADSPYIHHVQRIARAICGHFKRFSGFPVNARLCSARHSRPAARS